MIGARIACCVFRELLFERVVRMEALASFSFLGGAFCIACNESGWKVRLGNAADCARAGKGI